MSQSPLTQDNRLISISDFSLGKDTFLLTAFEGSESISGLFEFQIDVLSEDLDISPDKIVGRSGTVTVHNEIERVFHGCIKQFTFGEISTANLRQYRMTMVPWLWFLSKANNHRIFQEMNTKDIVSEVFGDHGFTDFDFRAEGGSTREYCVQHNESDLEFVSRLLEEDGIAYFFKHEKKKHQLVLVDKKNAYDEFEETSLEYSKGSNPNAEIKRWQHLYEFKKGAWSLNDYNFEEPKKDLFATTKTNSKFSGNDKFEHYEYPGLYDTTMGRDLVEIRLDAEESNKNTVRAASGCCSFYAGGRFNMAKHTTKAETGDYIVVSIFHRAYETSYSSGSQSSADYSNDFVCIPADVHFRPIPVHQRPVMKGPQSALVVGPDGEEIHVDAHGRIKVQFIWDRKGKKDENSSCWIRVMQSWAGNQWGASFIPRIGHEVIVNFLDGDPDRPLVVGSVYNGWNKPPFESKTQSGIRTRSTLDGSPQNFNEFRFDDKKGAEQVYIHAEKNFDAVVENDESLSVGNDETIDIGNDRSKSIGNNENSNIGNDRNKSVGNNQSESISKNKSIDVGENHTENIGKNVSISVGADHTESISKNMTISIDKDLSESVGGKYTESVTKEYGLQAKTITMQASDKITLKTGSAQIVMKKNGDITISGKNINIKGSGNVVLKGSKVTAN
ncbi:type VI secretion system Vgr family protein [Teredinibacter haidensis]|uniref:type VI secretion system Vgr family protein n=1 Tax=Teredinibacter haidensis TaxID=2731755 RepID=UPI000949029A|nr:type VI secretion system tip protein TssI/VgrG [Teredinibacter haidensis]